MPYYPIKRLDLSITIRVRGVRVCRTCRSGSVGIEFYIKVIMSTRSF